MNRILTLIAVVLLMLSVQSKALALWTEQYSDTISQFTSAHFNDANSGWVVGLAGKIIHTNDGGSTWQDQSVAATNFLTSVYFANSTTGWAVGLFGMIVKTNNGGASWSNQLNLNTDDLIGVYFANTTTGWAVGRNGTILKTGNGGAFWTTQTSGTTRDLARVRFISTTTGWAVGAGGTILKTAGGGSTWISLYNDTTKTFADVQFINSSTGWVVGAGGIIIKSTDGGTTWVNQVSGTTNELTSVHFNNANEGWAAGNLGTILKTTDGGANWTNMNSGSNAPLFDIQFVGPTTGWAIGWAGTVLKYSQVALNAPSLTSPGNQAINVGTSGDLIWQNTANSYRVQLSDTNNFSNLIINELTNSNSLAFNQLNYSTKYYWRVCSKDAADSSDWSATWDFTTMNNTATQAIVLQSGWNMISTNIVPQDSMMNAVLTQMNASPRLIKNMNGQVYSPPFQTSLNKWNISDAYMISMTNMDTLRITGTRIVPETTPISITATGWYWLPYYRTASMSPAIALASITGNYSQVKSINGQVYQPPFSLSLQLLEPSKGYMIKMSNVPASLVYPAN